MQRLMVTITMAFAVQSAGACPPDDEREVSRSLGVVRARLKDVMNRISQSDLERASGPPDARCVGDSLIAFTVTIRANVERVSHAVARANGRAERWLRDVAKVRPVEDVGRFGLTFITASNARATAGNLAGPMRERVVILVHGLDDPGVMWTDMIPALHAAGFTVGRFEYPNDGPIADAADLFARELIAARQAGIERVDVVAHSMGGLVARDALTRPDLYGGDGSGTSTAGALPAIDRFVMIGTPNHGSNMARLRGIIEVREHLFHALRSNHRLRDLMRMDGNGEAGRDLLPNSSFLTSLNARALPTYTSSSIIAGRLPREPLESIATVLERSPRMIRSAIADLLPHSTEEMVADVADGVGDGCVSIASARLDGVADFTIVNATHIGMILNVGGGRVPPAIPLVIERLQRPRE